MLSELISLRNILLPVERGRVFQGGALNLGQAKPVRKQLNLNKLSDGRRPKFSGCPTQVKLVLSTGKSIYTS